MKLYHSLLKKISIGFILLWIVGCANSQADAPSTMVSFGLYSFTPIPVRISGMISLSDGRQGALPVIPPEIKQAILSSETKNPFKAMYGHLYTPAFLSQLQNCPFIGMPYELDGDKNTTEWIALTVFYGCVKEYDSFMYSQPHNWILQQDADQSFKILMESDGRMLSITKSHAKQQNYDKLSTDHYVVNFSPSAQPQCGMAYIRWQYRQNHYQITEQLIRPDDCEQSFEFDGSDDTLDSPGDVVRKENEAKAQKAVEAVINPWLEKLHGIY